MTPDANELLAFQIDSLLNATLDGEVQNEWELDFIQSVAERFDEGHSLTGPQVDKIHELYERYF